MLGSIDVSETSIETVEVNLAAKEISASQSATTTVIVKLKNKDRLWGKGATVNLTVDKGTIQTPALDNNDGTYSAIYTAADSAGMAKISVVTGNGKLATTTIKLLELVLSPSQSTVELAAGVTFQTGELASVLVTLKAAGGLPISGREVTLIVDPADNLKLNPSAVTDQGGKASFQF